jgi:hypothetical protein
LKRNVEAQPQQKLYFVEKTDYVEFNLNAYKKGSSSVDNCKTVFKNIEKEAFVPESAVFSNNYLFLLAAVNSTFHI